MAILKNNPTEDPAVSNRKCKCVRDFYSHQ